ncbi:phosphotransferase [Phaeacidiphilus oryzae]|uniref:phosphotransferase n=1 Tax=Phaeacidiphilus oryzae TaxID=348818 RepID=UPI0005667E0B|nr:phosphotransferase [Phaeacidiphilus oryzae]
MSAETSATPVARTAPAAADAVADGGTAADAAPAESAPADAASADTVTGDVTSGGAAPGDAATVGGAPAGADLRAVPARLGAPAAPSGPAAPSRPAATSGLVAAGGPVATTVAGGPTLPTAAGAPAAADAPAGPEGSLTALGDRRRPGGGGGRPGGLHELVSVVRGRLPMLPPALLSAPLDELTIRRVAWRLGLAAPGRPSRTTADLLVARVGSLALKYPLSDRAAAALAREERVLARLAADERLAPESRALLPPVLPQSAPPRPAPVPLPDPSAPSAPDTVPPHPAGPDDSLARALGGGPALLQHWMPGRPASSCARRGTDPAEDPVTAAALAAVARIHHSTGQVRRVTQPLLDTWLLPGLAELRSQLGPWAGPGLAALERRLRTGLVDREVLCGWTHGDFHPGNVLLRPGASGPVATAVIDWVQGCPDGPAAIDGCMYLLARRHDSTGRELGACVVDVLRSGGLGPAERKLLAGTGFDAPAYGPDGALLPLLTWLWHVSGNLAKSARFARSHRWVGNNVRPVLEAVVTSG